MKLKIIFCGTPEFAAPSLRALLNSQHQVAAVFTQPDRPAGRSRQLTPSPIKKLAAAHQIPVYQPEKLDMAAQKQISDLAADLLVVVAYGLILPKRILQIPHYGAVNVHPSLLPRWRGAAPIQSTILAGDTQTGVSIIQLTQKMDAGPIIHQIYYPLNGKENSGQLHDILAQKGADALMETLATLAPEGWRGIAQEETLATYSQKIAKTDAQIDWSQTAEQLARQVRAYNPWPVAFTYFEGKILRVWEAEALGSGEAGPPGILTQLNHAIDIATGKGILRLLTVQLPGARPISAAEFIRGQRQYLQPKVTCFKL